jgi:hypothetical protein
MMSVFGRMFATHEKQEWLGAGLTRAARACDSEGIGMKLLMIYASRFAYRTSRKSLESVSEVTEHESIENAVVGFIHVEEKDEQNPSSVETKLVKNLKWAARKNETRTIVLHSFTHLSQSKAPSEMTKRLLDSSELRLRSADYEVHQTPFGYFLDLDIEAPGHPLARLFKDL